MQVEPLDNGHDRAGFASGVKSLDRYLRTRSSQDVRRRVASCFVLVDGDAVPRAYHTLAATSLALADLPAALAAQLPCHPLVPATLLARLAVDYRHRGQRLGEHMLLDAFARALRSEVATFAIVVHTKDESASRFFEAYDFTVLDSGGHRLFLPMTTIARLFA